MNSKLPIILFVVAVFLIVVIIIVAAHKKENNAHADNQKSGVAVIVGYDSESTSRDVRFSVRVIDSGDENTYNLKGVYNVKKLDGSLDEGYPYRFGQYCCCRRNTLAGRSPLPCGPPAGKTWRYRMGGRRKKLAGNVCHGGSKRAAA